jgi:hypothetical protein
MFLILLTLVVNTGGAIFIEYSWRLSPLPSEDFETALQMSFAVVSGEVACKITIKDASGRCSMHSLRTSEVGEVSDADYMIHSVHQQND